MEQIERKISENSRHLSHLVDYAIEILQIYIEMIEKNCPRKTKLKAFKKVEARVVARHDLALKYDAEGGYLGTEVSGEKLLGSLEIRQNPHFEKQRNIYNYPSSG